jgi:hypothetical protein
MHAHAFKGARTHTQTYVRCMQCINNCLPNQYVFGVCGGKFPGACANVSILVYVYVYTCSMYLHVH